MNELYDAAQIGIVWVVAARLQQQAAHDRGPRQYVRDVALEKAVFVAHADDQHRAVVVLAGTQVVDEGAQLALGGDVEAAQEILVLLDPHKAAKGVAVDNASMPSWLMARSM